MPLREALPPAIPPFQGNITEAWELIGQKEHYITQLQKEMLRRAEESNALDDQNKELKALNERLQRELGEAREAVADRELTIRKLTGKAGGKRKAKAQEG